MPQEPDQSPAAQAFCTTRFISVETLSGYRLRVKDPAGVDEAYHLPGDIQIIGNALRRALSASRKVTLAESQALRELMRGASKDWSASLIKRFSYSSRKDLYSHMNACMIDRRDNIIVISPMRHDSLEAWSSDKVLEQSQVMVEWDSSDELVGAALLDAFTK